ncbi:hypothetical protein K469DRAFT_767179 [Zopfia rhizophila CBS 207.26]|uniref:Helicase C-terminal domain-containing protein n=1 Tax=Zopfia rhizophila CBS 207.26 TaxID=1314779 RepID=A0A6A6DBR9_9PEZI|nr:hypothetical protein K469DRAFT_767179 [Zopfia rhizophila CBS 207.26]
MTARVNVAYQVVRVGTTKKQKEREKIVLKLIKRKIQKYKIEKIVVYYNTVSKVKRFIEVLDYSAYYHDAIEKNSMLKKFIKKDKQVIIATSSLDIGVNILDIRCIIYIN